LLGEQERAVWDAPLGLAAGLGALAIVAGITGIARGYILQVWTDLVDLSNGTNSVTRSWEPQDSRLLGSIGRVPVLPNNVTL
jgi:hypothetical protein